MKRTGLERGGASSERQDAARRSDSAEHPASRQGVQPRRPAGGRSAGARWSPGGPAAPRRPDCADQAATTPSRLRNPIDAPPLRRQLGDPSPLQKAAAARGPADFAHLLERRAHLGHERNAQIVDQFNLGQVAEINVVRFTCSRMRRARDDWNAAVACLQALSRCRHPQSGQPVLPNTILYTAAISACHKAGRWDKALALFDHLQTHGPARHVFPNTMTYSAAISACEKGGRGDEALALFEHLLTHGPAHDVFPDTIAYNAVISACGKGGRPEKALELFAHLQTHGPGRAVFPDTITYSAAISACEKNGQCDQALALFDHLQTHGPARQIFPDTVTYNAIISTCAKAGRPDEALALFDHLQEHGPARHVFADAITYSAAISACDSAGRSAQAAGLLMRGVDGVPGRPDSRVYRRSLGFHTASNMLDLHENTVLIGPMVAGARAEGVHIAVARTIFQVLLNEPEKVLGPGATGIGDKTHFVVGQHGNHAIKEAIAACMREQGWTPVHPTSAGKPNPGRLVAQPR